MEISVTFISPFKLMDICKPDSYHIYAWIQERQRIHLSVILDAEDVRDLPCQWQTLHVAGS